MHNANLIEDNFIINNKDENRLMKSVSNNEIAELQSQLLISLKGSEEEIVPQNNLLANQENSFRKNNL